MSEKFRNKYRIESTRLRNWDYGWNAAYFVTINTHNRICWFGNVVDGKMVLNDLGKIANDCWSEIPEHFPFVKLGAFVVMPNHVHGIVIIDKPDGNNNNGIPVEAQNFVSPQVQSPKNKFGPQSKNLASIIRGFKIGVTKNARKTTPDFTWQSRYHDHIIRNNESFYRISKYIKNNPANWSDGQSR